MSHCELWLEIKGEEKSFRVALLVPDEIIVPEGYTRCVGYDHPSKKKFYVSDWYPSIGPVKEKMNEIAQFYNDKGVKFLFFREIRKPLC
ncbi:MAG: hypothetical protein KAQ65_07200 [Candidatus Thorarchaeota archaeon]|nr:hypothetical protein [Candidatus Thorarchaeota archaeon]MCK5239422.1 hypothetical protein [Candidatus Thorarchaeota archaeon]